MGRYINPFTDWGFKKLFGQEANKELLISLLNILLDGERKISDLVFLDKEIPGESNSDRSLIYDIYCKTDTGEHIIVEMQNRTQANFIDRSLYYVARSLVSQAIKGDWMYNLTAVYGVFFMNFSMPHELGDQLRTDVILSDRDSGRQISDKLRMIYFQMPLFTKKENECENNFERIIYVLNKMEVLKHMPFEKYDFIFKKLGEIAEVRALTPEERAAYDESLKHYRDTMNVMQTQRNEGKEEGLAEGLAKGLAEGLARGKAEGRVELARKMKQKGMDLTLIADITGLTEKSIQDL